MFKLFQETIEQFDIITIFRHENPDLDALGSQFGLCHWIKDNYPNKKVYLCGSEFGRFSDALIVSSVDDEVINNSLAIIVDTANSARVDDLRYRNALKTMRIDHHPFVESFADVELIDEKSAATCELLGDFFTLIEAKVITKDTAELLYQGILTDTLCFKTNNTTPKTLYVASKLAETGLLIAKINQNVFDMDLATFKYVNYLRSNFAFSEGVAYSILTEKDIEPFGISINRAREYVSEFGNVKEFEIWCIFTQDDDNLDVYKGSLRSKTVVINEVAANYNGGGHKNACGVKNLTLEQVNNLIQELKALLV